MRKAGGNIQPTGQTPIVLNYASLRPRPGTRLAMEEAATDPPQVRVLFAVTPRWAFLLYVGGTLPLATLCALVATANFQMGQPDDVPLEGMSFFLGIIAPGLLALAIVGLAALALWRFALWVREHRVLVATRNGLLLSRVGLWRLHQKWWPADQIAAIELAPVWGSVRVIDTVAYLFIHTKSGQRRRFYLDTPDRKLPARIAERLSEVLGCPLKPKMQLNRQGAKSPGRQVAKVGTITNS